MNPLVPILVAVCLVSVPATFAQEPDYKAMPWHLMDAWWDVGEEQAFESVEVDVTIDSDVPEGVNLYISPIGLAHLNKIPFYGGIQTNADGYTKHDNKLRKIGPGYIFSMWGERSHDAIRPSEGGFCQSSGHEGDFVSVRRPHRWTKGTYTYRLIKMDREIVDGKTTTWVGGFVLNHQTQENVFIGALRFPSDELKLEPKIANFVEIYGRRIPVEEIPQLKVTFAPPRVNGREAEAPRLTAIYPKGVPDFADAQIDGRRLVVTVGTRVIDRQTRKVQLLPSND